MALQEAKNTALSFLNDLGRKTLHSLYPDEFEFYACSFELVDSNDRIIYYISLPIMPKNISINTIPLTKITKSAGGVVSLGSDTFNPFTMSLSGNFGRKLRLIINKGELELTGGVQLINRQKFSATIKTGYGLVKLLEKIYYKSQELDPTNRPYRLYFNNLAFNHSYLVEFTDFSVSQSEEMNMIWNYSMNLKAIAPAVEVRQDNDSSLKETINKNIFTKLSNRTLAFAKQQAGTGLNSLFQKTKV